jgi:transposase
VPPYSPDHNPIEKLRKAQAAAEQSGAHSTKPVPTAGA